MELPVYALAFGALTFAMHMGGASTRTALVLAAGAVLYAMLVGITAKLVNEVPFAPVIWRAALILIAGTGFATFLFPLAPLAIVLGIAFCALELMRRWTPGRRPAPDAT